MIINSPTERQPHDSVGEKIDGKSPEPSSANPDLNAGIPKQDETEDMKTKTGPGNRATAFFTCVIALATVVQVFVVYRQWIAMEKALTVTRENNEIGQRPWMLVVATTKYDPIPDQPATISIDFKNSGHSPAIGVVIRTRLRIDKNSKGFIPNYGYPTPSEVSEGSVGIDQVISSSVSPLTRSENEIAQLKSGIDALWLYGDVQYGDIFDGARVTTYCMKWEPSSGGFAACGTYGSIK